MKHWKAEVLIHFETMAVSRIKPEVLFLCLPLDNTATNRQRRQLHTHRVAFEEMSDLITRLCVERASTDRHVRALLSCSLQTYEGWGTRKSLSSASHWCTMQFLLMAHLFGSQLLNHPLVACDAAQQFGYSACCRQFVTISITLHKSPLWKHNTLPLALFCSLSCK